jgi:hypothetical protein
VQVKVKGERGHRFSFSFQIIIILKMNKAAEIKKILFFWPPNKNQEKAKRFLIIMSLSVAWTKP